MNAMWVVIILVFVLTSLMWYFMPQFKLWIAGVGAAFAAAVWGFWDNVTMWFY